jgi:hypothetical protein
MRRVYLFAYGNSLGTQEQVRNCVQQLPAMLMWRYDLPNAFYIVSDFDANTIATQIRNYCRNEGHFIVTQISSSSTDTQGWLPNATWHLIHKKTLLQ